ncbi:unnamed protein product, partial [Musa acuminata subsp. burmannicoides]
RKAFANASSEIKMDTTRNCTRQENKHHHRPWMRWECKNHIWYNICFLLFAFPVAREGREEKCESCRP